MGSAFLPYLVAGFVSGDVKNSALGGLRTAGLIIAMVVQPWAGLLSDRSTSRFGRRRPFIFIGVLLDLVFLAAVYLSGTFWILLAATLFQQFSANISHGPLQGLIPDLVPEDERGRASAVKAIFAAKKKPVEKLAEIGARKMTISELSVSIPMVESNCELIPAEDLDEAARQLLRRLKEERYL